MSKMTFYGVRVPDRAITCGEVVVRIVLNVNGHYDIYTRNTRVGWYGYKTSRWYGKAEEYRTAWVAVGRQANSDRFTRSVNRLIEGEDPSVSIRVLTTWVPCKAAALANYKSRKRT